MVFLSPSLSLLKSEMGLHPRNATSQELGGYCPQPKGAIGKFTPFPGTGTSGTSAEVPKEQTT